MAGDAWGEDPSWQNQRSQELEENRKKIAIKLVSLVLAVTVTAYAYLWKLHRETGRVYAFRARLTLANDETEGLLVFDRESKPDVYYRVILGNSPRGRRLSMSCDWTDPNGQIIYQNSYRTRRIDRDLWPTHCHYRFGPMEPRGTWTVSMWLDDRELAAASFELR